MPLPKYGDHFDSKIGLVVLTQPKNSLFDLTGGSPPSVVYNFQIGTTINWTFDFYQKISAGITHSPLQKINLHGAPIQSYVPTLLGTVNKLFELTRIVSGIGKYEDTWALNSQILDSRSYIILQKAVTVVNYEKNGVDMGLLDTSPKTVQINDIITLDSVNSRGVRAINGFDWKILISDPTGLFLNRTATENVDYELVDFAITQRKIKIKFLSQYNFTIKLTINGDTFKDNPYESFPLDTTQNIDVKNYFFNTETSTANIAVTFPKISLTLDSEMKLGDTSAANYIFTTYQNQLISVALTLESDPNDPLKPKSDGGASWEINGAPAIPEKTIEDYKKLMLEVVNIVLEVRNKKNNELILTREGLIPYSISLPKPDEYMLQIKTTLK